MMSCTIGLKEGDSLPGSFFEPRSGVYAVAHKASHRAYIGQSMNILSRWMFHCGQLSQGTHHNSLLQDVWEQEGAEGIRFEILEFCELDRLLERELEHMKAWHRRWGIFNKLPERNPLGRQALKRRSAPGNKRTGVGEVQYLTVRECAETLGIHAQTFKNWLTGDRHNLVVLLEPERVGVDRSQLIIPIGRWDNFLVNDWPKICKGMKGYRRKAREAG